MHFSHGNIVEKEGFLAHTNNTLVGFGQGVNLWGGFYRVVLFVCTGL